MPKPINQLVHDAVDLAIAAGDGVVPSREAKSALPGVLALDGLKPDQCKHIAPLVLAGLELKVKAYAPPFTTAMAAQHRDLVAGQIDLSDIDGQFGRVIRMPVAMDEAPASIRLMPLQMMKTQLTQHTELLERKGTECWAKSSAYRRFMSQHPEWDKAPSKTMAQILGLDSKA